MYQHNQQQPRPRAGVPQRWGVGGGAGVQQAWGGGQQACSIGGSGGVQQAWGGGGRQQDDVRVLSSNGYRVYGGAQQQQPGGGGVGAGPMYRGHYQGSVVIAGGGDNHQAQSLSSPQPISSKLQGTTPQAQPTPNPFLSAFEKSFESFLNSKYNDDDDDADVDKSEHKKDPSSVENISSILHDFSKSSNSVSQHSNPLHIPLVSSPAPPLSVGETTGTKMMKQRTLPKSNSVSKPKPQYNPLLEAKVPTIPRSMTIVRRTVINTTPVTSNNSSPQSCKTGPLSKLHSMPSRVNSPKRLLSPHQNPQGGRISKSVNSGVETIVLEPETVVIDEPDEKALFIDDKTVDTKADSDRVYQCNSCPKAFKSNSHLKDHEVTHTGNYPYRCETCKKGFMRENKLNNHKCLGKEEKIKPFKCEECLKSYASKKTLLEHKCTSVTEVKNGIKKIEIIEEEEILGEILESVELDVPVILKCSEIVFSSIYGVAKISGDLIEFEDFDCDLEEAVKDGWEVEVIGDDDHIIWQDSNVPFLVDTPNNIIPDGVEEIAKCTGFAVNDVKNIFEFFCKSSDDVHDKQPARLPWQEIPSVYERSNETKVNHHKSKDELLLGDEKENLGSSTMEELTIADADKVPKNANDNKQVSVNKFTYFNDTLESTVGAGSGDDSDDDWTLGDENKCKVCKKRFSSKWHLKKHRQTHTDKDKKGTYKCVSCRKGFKRKDLRDKHKCDHDVSKSVLESTLIEDVDMSSDNETVGEKVDILTNNLPSRRSLVLHSTLM